ncbi:hypothetical protein H0A36_13640 [Endozoicomonas sp. SM1973]|uniref:Solute-binding protein family 3/N-terminal domain-containing protein n=1 Tax=Spartinivicinus marinus TaxID=2994442 RepID=A0A853I8U3_9GAMM|nr:hypothetical protein [Spartinivicinus marinus]MCX4027062.1 hypothetical protein [Spartinivicinus marinus]NYZ67058.1 hypothetical protein [Spartinivicinus marinus]
MMIKYLSGLLFIIHSSVILANHEKIYLYTYHNHPPFINEKNKGLSFELEKFLNNDSNGRYQFELQILPRKRLNKKIENNGPWVVIWANPAWFNDKKKIKYRWASMLKDSSSIISRLEKPVEYKGLQSLQGLIFGGMAGHKYVGIDRLVDQGKIKRIDGDHERNNLKVLLKGRIDFTLLPTSTINYLIDEMSVKEKIYIAPEKHTVFYRMFLISKNRKDLEVHLTDINKDNDWLEIARKYGFKDSHRAISYKQ